MKPSIAVLLLTTALLPCLLRAQGTFGNLNFESATVPSLPSDQATFISTANALPNWSVYVGTNQVPQALYNGISIGGALVSLIDRHTAVYSNDVIEGNFTISLDPGYDAQDGTVSTAAIAQTGVIPATARALLFNASANVSALLLTFNGRSLPIVLLSSAPNFQTYGADISDLAGLSGELRFTEQPITPPVYPIAFLDDIQFSPSVIPEPGTFWQIVLAMIIVTAQRAARVPLVKC